MPYQGCLQSHICQLSWRISFSNYWWLTLYSQLWEPIWPQPTALRLAGVTFCPDQGGWSPGHRFELLPPVRVKTSGWRRARWSRLVVSRYQWYTNFVSDSEDDYSRCVTPLWAPIARYYHLTGLPQIRNSSGCFRYLSFLQWSWLRSFAFPERKFSWTSSVHH